MTVLESPFSYRRLRTLIRETDALIYKMKTVYKKAQREGIDGEPNQQAALFAGLLKIQGARAKELQRMAEWWKKGRREGMPLGATRCHRSGITTKEIIKLCQPNAVEELAELMRGVEGE